MVTITFTTWIALQALLEILVALLDGTNPTFTELVDMYGDGKPFWDEGGNIALETPPR